jgi:hypothetical protein
MTPTPTREQAMEALETVRQGFPASAESGAIPTQQEKQG